MSRKDERLREAHQALDEACRHGDTVEIRTLVVDGVVQHVHELTRRVRSQRRRPSAIDSQTVDGVD